MTRLLAAFDSLEIHYMVGGSAASGLYGHVRLTRDIDVVARIRMEDIGPLVKALESEFYLDAGRIRSAIELGRSFNLIHFQSNFKFDVFPLAADRYQQEQFARRRSEVSNMFGPEAIKFVVATPEDVILSKLWWYSLGRGVSEQQWNDVWA